MKSSIIPNAIENNYPFKIDFNKLLIRIVKFKDVLTKIICSTFESYYFNFADQIYKDRSTKVLMPMTLMNQFNILRVSYIMNLNFK